MISHRCLKQFHSCKSLNLILWNKQHDHCCTATDYNCVDKYAQCLNKSCLYREITLCRSRCTWSRSWTSFIWEQSSLHSIHQNSSKTTCCHLTDSKCFLKNTWEHTRCWEQIGKDQKYCDQEITHCHNRNNNIQNLYCCILSKHDHCCQNHQNHSCINRWDRKCIFKRRRHWITDHLANTTPTD